MQEAVDEAKFALEGLTPGSSVRVVRASLVALAQLLSSSGRRRVLQAHGLGKPLLTAIITLRLGESLLRLAAAAVVYFLSMDDLAHRSLLDSDDVIRLVLSFLEEGESVAKKKPETKRPGGIFGGFKGSGGDKVAAEQARKVQELFGKGDATYVGLTGGQVATPEWLGLLALEQASMAAAQLEQGVLLLDFQNFVFGRRMIVVLVRHDGGWIVGSFVLSSEISLQVGRVVGSINFGAGKHGGCTAGAR
jgi:hypothetical protein